MTIEQDLDAMRGRLAQVQTDLGTMVDNLKAQLLQRDMDYITMRNNLEQQLAAVKDQLTAARAALAQFDEASKVMEQAIGREARKP